MSSTLGGGNKTTQTVSSGSAPWEPAQPYLTQVLGEAGNQYANGTGAQVYTGQRVADPSWQTVSGQNGIINTAAWAANGGSLANPSIDVARSVLTGNGLNADTMSAISPLLAAARGDNLGTANPYLDRALDRSSEDARNRVNASFSASGRYGSGGHTGVLAKELADSRNSVLAQNYENERQRQLDSALQAANLFQGGQNRQLQTINMAPQIMDQFYDPYRQYAAVGAAQDALGQQRLNANIQQFDEQQQAPIEALQRYSALVGGVGSLGRSGTQTTQAPGRSPLLGALGGAAAGNSLFGGYGALLGGALGAFGG